MRYFDLSPQDSFLGTFNSLSFGKGVYYNYKWTIRIAMAERRGYDDR